MRVLDTTFSLLTFWQHLVFTEAALLAHADTVALAAPFTTLLDAFEGMHSADLKTRRGAIQAQARAVIADMNVDDGLRKLHSDTLSEVTQDREHPIFKALFESDIAATIRFALARQLTTALTIVENLALSLIPAALKSHVDTLKKLIEAGQVVLKGRSTAAFERTESNLASGAWKDDVNAVRLSTYGALLGVAAKTRRSKVWAESFFSQSPEPRESVDTDTDNGTPPVTPTPEVV